MTDSKQSQLQYSVNSIIQNILHVPQLTRKIRISFFPQATCCADKIHCCPSGYKCTDQGDCTKEGTSLVVPWSMHVRNQAAPKQPVEVCY